METSLAHVPHRLSLAKQYAQVAHSESTRRTTASASVAAGNAVLAGIAAADVLCIIHLRIRSTSTNHNDAITVLREFDATAAKDLAILLHEKGQAHYGMVPIDKETLTRMLRGMQRLIDRAVNASAALNPK